MNHEELMQYAIDTMRKSKVEDRDDGKIPPKVGALIIKKDGSIESAYRGEFRSGDHAEYTLLDKKNKCNDVTGSTMYVTLEPCAPGARGCRKTSCAERIVNARISKVYVACIDPDPKVAKAGLNYLQDNNIEVLMFDKKYQDIVYEENDDFFKQCYERAIQAEKLLMKPKIDAYKQDLDISIMSDEAIDYYCEKSSLNKDMFYSALTNLGLIENNKFNNQAILLFGRKPRDFFPQAGVKITYNFTGKINYIEFDEPLILIADKIQAWYSSLPKITNRDDLIRESKEIYPFEVIREALINAIVHRDYDIDGAKISIMIDDKKISIKSPGQPVQGITFEQIQNFSAPSLARNPKISYLFNRIKMMEETGLGMRTFKEVPEKYNLPLPVYSSDKVNIILDLYFSEKAKSDSLKSQIANDSLRMAYDFICSVDGITKEEYVMHFNLSERTARRQLKELVDMGLIEMRGKSVNIKYFKK